MIDPNTLKIGDKVRFLVHIGTVIDYGHYKELRARYPNAVLVAGRDADESKFGRCWAVQFDDDIRLIGSLGVRLFLNKDEPKQASRKVRLATAIVASDEQNTREFTTRPNHWWEVEVSPSFKGRTMTWGSFRANRKVPPGIYQTTESVQERAVVLTAKDQHERDSREWRIFAIPTAQFEEGLRTGEVKILGQAENRIYNETQPGRTDFGFHKLQELEKSLNRFFGLKDPENMIEVRGSWDMHAQTKQNYIMVGLHDADWRIPVWDKLLEMGLNPTKTYETKPYPAKEEKYRNRAYWIRVDSPW